TTTESSLARLQTTSTALDVPVELLTSGAHRLEVRATDSAGNTTISPLSVFVDLRPPVAAALENQPSSVIREPFDSLDVTFAQEIDIRSFGYEDISVSRNGISVDTSNIEIVPIGGGRFRLN